MLNKNDGYYVEQVLLLVSLFSHLVCTTILYIVKLLLKKIETGNLCFRSCLFVQWVQILCTFIYCDECNLATKVHYINRNMCVYMYLVGVWMFNIRVNVVLAMEFFIYCFKVLCFISW